MKPKHKPRDKEVTKNHWKPNQSDVCLDRVLVNDVGRRSITGMERSRFLRWWSSDSEHGGVEVWMPSCVFAVNEQAEKSRMMALSVIVKGWRTSSDPNAWTACGRADRRNSSHRCACGRGGPIRQSGRTASHTTTRNTQTDAPLHIQRTEEK